MTQILAALTQEYVLIASDRQLTFVSGPQQGRVADDKTCKLVSLCGIWVIGYTGFSKLDGMPTNEWIATRLADKGCRDPFLAAQIIADAATPALKSAPFTLELTFLIAGWLMSAKEGNLQPHFLLVSNVHDANGIERPASYEFNRFERRLSQDEVYAARVIGQPLPKTRGKLLDRFLRRMLKRGLGPKLAMQAFAKEIINTSRPGGTVGTKILACSIPKAAAKQAYLTGGSMLLAMEPDLQNTAFCFFDNGYSQLKQYGPTFACGDMAVTDLETEDDPTRDYQSSSLRFLRLPKAKKRPAEPAEK